LKLFNSNKFTFSKLKTEIQKTKEKENRTTKEKRGGQQPTGPHPGPKPGNSPAVARNQPSLAHLSPSLAAQRDPPVGSFFSSDFSPSLSGFGNRR
jgi:hypothetical protein